MSRLVVSGLALALGFGLSAPARGQERPRPPVEQSDLWSEPYVGVRYLQRTTTAPCTVHVLEIHLDAEGVAVETSDPETRWQTVEEQAHAGGFVAAINGGFWHNLSTPAGLHVHEGETWERSEDDGLHGTLWIDERGRAHISMPEQVIEELPRRLRFATSGRPSIVREGELDAENIDPIGTANLRQPRTAAGVDGTGRVLWLAVTDGRSELSKGMTLYELGRLMIELGAVRALNLDGGGSSTLYVERLGGVANAPSGGSWERALGLGVEL